MAERNVGGVCDFHLGQRGLIVLFYLIGGHVKIKHLLMWVCVCVCVCGWVVCVCVCVCFGASFDQKGNEIA